MLFFLLLIACLSLIGMTLLYLRSEKEKEKFRSTNVGLTMTNLDLHRRNFDLKAKDTVQAYEALDKGMTEVQDAYATDIAQYEDSLKKAHEEIGLLRIQKDDLKKELEEVSQAAFELNLEIMNNPNS